MFDGEFAARLDDDRRQDHASSDQPNGRIVRLELAKANYYARVSSIIPTPTKRGDKTGTEMEMVTFSSPGDECGNALFHDADSTKQQQQDLLA